MPPLIPSDLAAAIVAFDTCFVRDNWAAEWNEGALSVLPKHDQDDLFITSRSVTPWLYLASCIFPDEITTPKERDAAFDTLKILVEHFGFDLSVWHNPGPNEIIRQDFIKKMVDPIKWAQLEKIILHAALSSSNSLEPTKRQM